MTDWAIGVATSADARTSAWWAVIAAGYVYFAYLALRRFFGGPTRGRASIVAFSATGIVVATTAVLIRTNTFTIHDGLIEARTMAFALALWWMIGEFRGGNITTGDECPFPHEAGP